MSPPAGTIDLGELPRGEQPEIAVGWPAVDRLQRWRGRHAWRLVGAAATAALVLTATGAADARREPPLTLQFTVPAADYNVAYDEAHLYVFDDASGPGQTAVTAYRLDDGTVQWQASVPGGPSWLALWGEALLVVTYPDDPGDDWPTDRTTRLDRDSGEPLWTRNGWPAGEASDRLLFSESIPSPDADQYQYQRTRLSAVDPLTGDPAWSVDVDRWDFELQEPPTRLVTLNWEGRLSSYDLATGELLATAPTAASTDPEQAWFWGVRTIGSLTLVLEEIDGETVINAYDVEDLRPRWTLAGVTTDLSGQVSTWPARCGELVCFHGPGAVPRAIDPATGATAWTADWAGGDAGAGSYEIFDPGVAPIDGHAILTRTPHPTDDGGSWLIDTATGSPVLDLQQWTVAGNYLPQVADSPTGVLTRSGQAGTWIGRLRPDLSGVDALGLIETAAVNDEGYGAYCLPSATYVVCLTEVLSGRRLSHVDVAVWTLPE